jgi:hypothetical protein
MSRLLITELPACGLSRGGNYPKTLRGPVGKERPAGPRSHSGSCQTLVPSDRRLRRYVATPGEFDSATPGRRVLTCADNRR